MTRITLSAVFSAVLTLQSGVAVAMEPNLISDLAIAMRYDEICSAFDRNSNAKAVRMMEIIQENGINMSRLNADDLSKINYGRGLVDGFHHGYSVGNGYKSACDMLRRELIDKL